MPSAQKPLLRRAEAYEKLDQLEEALKGRTMLLSVFEVKLMGFSCDLFVGNSLDLDAVLKIDPTIQPAVKSHARLKKIVEERQEKMKAEMLDKLKGFGNTILGKFGLSTENFQMVQDPTTGSYNINFTQNPQSEK